MQPQRKIKGQQIVVKPMNCTAVLQLCICEPQGPVTSPTTFRCAHMHAHTRTHVGWHAAATYMLMVQCFKPSPRTTQIKACYRCAGQPPSHTVNTKSCYMCWPVLLKISDSDCSYYILLALPEAKWSRADGYMGEYISNHHILSSSTFCYSK